MKNANNIDFLPDQCNSKLLENCFFRLPPSWQASTIARHRKSRERLLCFYLQITYFFHIACKLGHRWIDASNVRKFWHKEKIVPVGTLQFQHIILMI